MLRVVCVVEVGVGVLIAVVELGVVIRVSRFVGVAPVLMEQCHQYGSLEAYV